VRLCSYYLTDQQVLLGNGLLALALFAGSAWIVRAFTGSLRPTATALHDSDRGSG
jgi:hypothetical protein